MADKVEKKNRIGTASQNKDNICKALLFVSWLLILAWRIYVMVRYSFHYVDDDQAIMWYATVHYAHGHFPEPCFFGQDYNVMLESLLAVPLYLCGWPLHVALPLVTVFLCVLPYLVCSILLWRKGQYTGALLAVLLLALSGWEWDVLTTIPRAWISGFPWAVLGAILINDEQNRKGHRVFGGFLSALGFSFSLTAAAVIGIALANFVMIQKKKVKEYIPVVLGLLAGSGNYLLQKLFYGKHPEYMITRSSVDFAVNSEELGRIFRNAKISIAQSFCLGKIGLIILPIAIVTVLASMLKKKRYREAVLVGLSVCGSVFVLFFGWMDVFWEGSILYGQLRMLLFWNFLALTLVMLTTGNRQKDGSVKKAIVVIFASLLIGIAGKICLFERELANPYSALYEDEMVEVMPVDSLERQADQMVQVAGELGADVLVTTARARVFAFAASALHYDAAPVFYVPDKERRTWVYQDMCEKKDRRLLLYSLPVGGDMQCAVIDLQGMSVADYFAQTYGIYRGTIENWGFHQRFE